MIIFLCDGILELQDPQQDKKETEEAEETKMEEEEKEDQIEEEFQSRTSAMRFFRIARELHLDLQMVLVNRCLGSSSNSIPSHDRELAFRSLALEYSDPK